MKTKLLIALCILTFNSFAQEIPKFSDVFFIQLFSDKTSDFIAKDTTITVPNGKVWQITNAKVFMTTFEKRVVGDKTYLYLNDQLIAYMDSRFAQPPTSPIWLEPGKYKLTIRTDEISQKNGAFNFIAFITGVEYSVLK